MIKIIAHTNTQPLFQQILRTDASKSKIIIRVMVGGVFLSEGIQKFLFPDELGAGRFQKMGLPNPEFFGSFVGTFEIICGTLILLGLFTRLATIPLLVIMFVALATTKAEILTEKGFWEMMHASRTDWTMLLGNLFLLLNGGGKWSLDKILLKNGA